MALDFFSISIFLLISVMLFFIVKTYSETLILKRKGLEKSLILNEKFSLERRRLDLNYEKSKLANDFNNIIVNRLIVIINELLSVQKLLFDK